jgi:hypothetical protein
MSPDADSRCLLRIYVRTNHSGLTGLAFVSEVAGTAAWKDDGSICSTPEVEVVAGQRNWAKVEPCSC